MYKESHRKTKRPSNTNPPKKRACSGRTSSFCSTSDIGCVTIQRHDRYKLFMLYMSSWTTTKACCIFQESTYSFRGAHAVDSSLFTSTHLGIVYGSFGCNGNEERPELCSHSNTTNCNSARLAAVRCGELKLYIYRVSTVTFVGSICIETEDYPIRSPKLFDMQFPWVDIYCYGV